MTDRTLIARNTAQGLKRFAGHARKCPVTVGFDGFVDSIISVVDKRLDAKHYEPVGTIDRFGQKIVAAAGMSSNYELVVTREKLGGNGPIMASAFTAFGLPVSYIGMLGKPTIHPVFADFAAVAKVYSIDRAALTDALEFEDGKLMLGKHDSLKQLTWDNIVEVVGQKQLLSLLDKSVLIGNVNWTMLPNLSSVWKKLIEVLPKLPSARHGRKHVFIDLADPEKRTAKDLRAALGLISKLQKVSQVTLGLNLKEATQVAGVLGIDGGHEPEDGVEALARALRRKLGVFTVVIHPRKSAAAARVVEGVEESAFFAGPFVAQPKLSTGAGDNFNAGFCLGTLAGLALQECLCAGTATSGYYVRNAASPTLEQLARFCTKLPNPQER